MTAALIRKSLTCLFSKNSSFLCKSYVSFSLYFSTDSEKQPLDTPAISEFLMHKHHFSPESASQVASVLTRLKNLDKADSVLSFLKKTGFSNIQLEKTAKDFPSLLTANLETTIEPKIRIFKDFGFTGNEIGEIISKQSHLLHYSVDNRLVPLLSVLKGLLGSNVEVAKFLRMSGWGLKSLEKTLVQNVEFLKSCGVPMEQIIWSMKNTRFLLNKPEMMRKFVEKTDHMGFDRSDRRFIYAVRVVSTMTDETWELKLKTLRELGFSENDILRVFRYSPVVFTASEKKMRRISKILLETGKYNRSCIINRPTALLYSVERRYRPRLQVLRELEKKKLIEKWPSLGTLHLITDAKFFEKFVAPYLDEVGEVWSAVSGIKGGEA